MNSDSEHTQDLDKAQLLWSRVEPMVDAIQRVSGLDDFQAKTCAYYSIATHGLAARSRFPILVFLGPFSSGKSQAMKVMRHLVKDPVWMSTTPSKASLRDKLGNSTTAFIEEADGVNEEIIRNRHDRDTASAPVKRQLPSGAWMDTQPEFFGATVLHRRDEFEDLATASRSIVVKTRSRPGDYVRAEDIEGELAGAAGIASAIWENCRLDGPRSGRPEDVWWPLAIVAENLGDTEWLEQCRVEVEKAEGEIRWGSGFEHGEAVVSALIGLARKELKGAPQKKDMSFLLQDVPKWLAEEYNWRPSTKKVGVILRRHGFDVRKSGGHMKVFVNIEFLVKKARELDIEDDALNDLGRLNIRDLE